MENAATIKSIPDKVKKLHKRILKKDNHVYTVPIPDEGIPVISTGTGTYKAGVKGWIIGGSERIVFLGEECFKAIIPEFDVLFEHGGIHRQQYGRDIQFS